MKQYIVRWSLGIQVAFWITEKMPEAPEVEHFLSGDVVIKVEYGEKIYLGKNVPFSIQRFDPPMAQPQGNA